VAVFGVRVSSVQVVWLASVADKRSVF